ncbi:endonuclease domain-containing protein [Saccharopolyspora griseoalba]|uniref:Endonuclease domain-containing protein n=1 Tax=Saccharopolyspora griseoalba TaxID=1431848 RepID=A0ABW2LGA1_9PSEU
MAAGLTDEQLQSSMFKRVLWGVYTTWNTPLTHELKCAAAALTVPEGSVITGRSAAVLRGVPLADFGAPVEVLVPSEQSVLRRRGLRCSSARISEREHSEWGRIGVAGFARAGFDLLKQRGAARAVAHCDALLHAGVLSVEEIAGFLAGRRDHGVRRALSRLPLLDGRAESVPESVLRVELVLGGLHPVPQWEVFDGEDFVARLDLAFPEVLVAVEYDGGWHAAPEQIGRDRARRARLHALGWRVLVVTHDELRGELDALLARICAAVRATGAATA